MNMKANPFNGKMAALAGVLLLAAGGIFFLSRSGSEAPLPAGFPGGAAGVSFPPPGDDPRAGFRTYTHPGRRFSLEYPGTLAVETFAESDGAETIVFQNAPGDPAGRRGFQIAVSPFAGAKRLTPELVAEELPATLLEDPAEVALGDGTRALGFWSRDPRIGRTREVWFVRGGSLYAVTTYGELGAWLSEILSRWRFAD